MDDARAFRIGGWAGIVFSFLSLIVVPLVATPPPPPVLGAPGAEFVAWYGAHRTGFLVGNYLGIAAFFPGFVQLVVLAARVQKLEGAGGWLSSLILTTGTFGYAIFACSLVLFQVLPFLVEPKAAEGFAWFAAIWFALDGLAALPLVLAVGWAIVRTNMLPRWLAHASWAVAAIALVMSLGGLTATPAWLAGGGAATFLGFVAFFAWTLAIAIVMVRAR